MQHKAFPSTHAGTDRRAHLREYLLACIRDQVLSWADLTSPGVLDKLLRTLSADVREVLTGLGRTGGANAARLAALAIGKKLMDFAADLDAPSNRSGR
jgi:hypothetical protein